MTEPAASADVRPRFEFRAQTVLAISIAVLAIASVVIVNSGVLDTVETAVRSVGVLVTFGVLVVTWVGLGRGAAWATAAAVPILLLTILVGLADVVAGLAQSRLTVPFAAIAAWWALRAYRPTVGAGSGSIRPAVVLVAAFIAGWSWGLLANPLLVDGGPLRASRNDLVVEIGIDCGPPSRGAPEVVGVVVSWSWTRSEPVPSAPDAIAVAWTQSESSGDWRFVPERLDDGSDPWIVAGSGDLSGAAADVWLARMDDGVTFTVDPLGIFSSHAVWLELAPGASPGSHGDVDVQARYFHGGRWDSGVVFKPGGACRW